MARSLFEMVTATAIAAYYEQLATNRIPYMGEGLFPSKRKSGLKLEWILGADNLPVALQPSAFDAKPLLRDRGGVGMESTKMPFFREAMRMGEEDRQNLLMFLEANRDGYAQSIIQRIFDDTASLIESSMVTPEIMRMALLSDGKFTIASSDDSGQSVSYDYNYDPKGTWASKNLTTLAGTDAWSDHENSDPIGDIQEIKRQASARGITLTRMIIGWSTWQDILANKRIRLGMHPLAAVASNVIVTDEQVRAFVQNLTGVRIAVYEKIYKGLDGNEHHFYPDHGSATLLPSGNLGYTWYGTTPEQADLMSGNTLADVRIVNTGVAVSTEKIALPVNVINWVSEIVLPSFESMNKVFNIKYAA